MNLCTPFISYPFSASDFHMFYYTKHLFLLIDRIVSYFIFKELPCLFIFCYMKKTKQKDQMQAIAHLVLENFP